MIFKNIKNIFMSGFIVFLAVLLYFSSIVFAITTVGGEFNIHKNDTVEKITLLVANGTPMPWAGAGGDYEIRITGDKGPMWSEKRHIDFGNENSIFVSTYMPYMQGMKTFQILHNGTVIFSEDLVLCNNNALCETEFGENYQACPEDCKIAIPFKPKEETNIFYVILIVILAIISSMFYYKLSMRRKVSKILEEIRGKRRKS